MKAQIIMHLIFRIHHAAIELYAVITVILKQKLMNWQNMKITVEVVQNDVKIVENLWCWSISSYIWILTMLSWNLKMVTALINFFPNFQTFLYHFFILFHQFGFLICTWTGCLSGCQGVRYFTEGALFSYAFFQESTQRSHIFLFYANKDWASRTYFKTQN